MAIFHLTAKVISRGKGQSAIAAAAYRSGERLRDEQADQQKYYTSRAERIVFTDIMAPKDAPEWAHDRNALWNHAERAEKRRDAQLAREIEVALPHELTDQQREWLVKDFAREAFVRKGYVVDIAIHAPDRESDERNHHAHLMVTMRRIGADGFAKTKESDQERAAKREQGWTRQQELGAWREQWAHLANRHLERHGHEARIDHRSLKEQGIDREATLHLGYAANEIAQRGAQSDRMDALREIMARNEIRVDLAAISAELKARERVDGGQGSGGGGRFRKAGGQDEDEARRRHSTVDSLDWTDRGGMAPQQASALKAVRNQATTTAPASANHPDPAALSGPASVADAKAERLARLDRMFEGRASGGKTITGSDDSHTPGRGGRGRTR